jgi:hypothetical protein
MKVSLEEHGSLISPEDIVQAHTFAVWDLAVNNLTTYKQFIPALGRFRQYIKDLVAAKREAEREEPWVQQPATRASTRKAAKATSQRN